MNPGDPVAAQRYREAAETFELLSDPQRRAAYDRGGCQVDRTRDMFRDGKQLLLEVGKDLRLELRLTWNGGMQILKKIERSNYNVLADRPTLSLFDKASLLVSSLKGY